MSTTKTTVSAEPADTSRPVVWVHDETRVFTNLEEFLYYLTAEQGLSQEELEHEIKTEGQLYYLGDELGYTPPKPVHGEFWVKVK